MTSPTESFLVFHASSTFPNAFGNPTIVVTASSSATNRFRGEYFTVHLDGEEKMRTGTLNVNGADIPPEVLTVDLKFVLDEAFQFALNGYREIVCQAYPQATELNLFRPPFEIVPIEKAHLARLWMRNKFHSQLAAIEQNTSCNELRSFLGEVKHLPVIDSSAG
jgi:hypothetical protein